MPAGEQPEIGGEQDDAQFAEGAVGIDRHGQNQRAEPADAAEKNGEDEPSTVGAEPHGSGQALDTERIEPKQHAQEDAGEKGGEFGFLGGPDGMADGFGGLIQGLLIAHGIQHIAKLEPQIPLGDEDRIAPG